MSASTDAAYALSQLRGIGAFSIAYPERLTAARDRIQRAIDALERIVGASEGDPAGVPAVSDFGCRVVPTAELPAWVDDRTRRFAGLTVVLIDSISQCGPAGRQEFPAVAVVLEQDGPNPGLAIHGLSTVGLAEKIVAFVKTRPWES